MKSFTPSPTHIATLPRQCAIQGRTRDVVAGGGGALKAEVLNRAAKASRGESMRGGGLNPSMIRGSGGLARKFFLKSMYLRTHFKPF